MGNDRKTPVSLSQDAAIVLGLAETSVHFAISPEDEAERWVRVLRLHGQVGAALQALGVGEAPLETPAQPRAVRILRRRPLGEDAVAMVTARAKRLARLRGADIVTTVDVLFAVFDVYGKAFDRALYVRGTTREELVERLRSGVPAPVGDPPAAA
jgi:glutathione S-transferase